MDEIIVSTKQEIKNLIKECIEEYIPKLRRKDKLVANVLDSKGDLINRKELLTWLNISPVKLWRMMRSGEIPYQRLGRKVFFSVEMVKNAMEKWG